MSSTPCRGVSRNRAASDGVPGILPISTWAVVNMAARVAGSPLADRWDALIAFNLCAYSRTQYTASWFPAMHFLVSLLSLQEGAKMYRPPRGWEFYGSFAIPSEL
ncbi:hypothetical protein Zmor_003312 [Zophobas morio]|uniref:Uncharacterized protein n=1 Tax=Zophobas morio TaxID=2755281 RepID=A0AA38HMS0_9CUCU|nr:hypothetical protein Zmor_003312 [Zophobas morio]